MIILKEEEKKKEVLDNLESVSVTVSISLIFLFAIGGV